MARFLVCVLTFWVVCVTQARADTPANCTFEDVEGDWTFYESDRTNQGSSINCNSWTGPSNKKLQVQLLFPNLAVDEYGNKGYWTIIYNQGFEVVLNYRKYFAFSSWEKNSNGSVSSFCSATNPGWSHDILGKNWACFSAVKNELKAPKLSYVDELTVSNGRFRNSKHFIKAINRAQSLWKARPYAHFENMTHEELLKMRGGRKSRIIGVPHPAPLTEEMKILSAELPEEFDWRNASGVNYVSPVRNQGSCGSCYSFATMGMLEARLRILTGNRDQAVLAPQDIVSCSEYSQGCDGGFPYLIGKYGQDFGVVPEECNPYQGKDGPCTTSKDCLRTYVAAYKYVGGFYGGCNEELMKINLVKNGPIAVAFEVYSDFQHYSGGIYHHTGLQDGYNPFEITNHAVLLVGYGADPNSGEKYWIVKNSWGSSWGENGFFRIRRGVDECSIESIAVEAFPIA